MRAFYNEIDRFCCDWLQNLMDAGHITPGVICDKSIIELTPDEVKGFDRVHFFAGIAGWDLALNLAGWDGSVWTGSCPCQPFSAAGKQRGSDDERHLWPAFFDLIRECKPAVVFGEQVAGAAGLAWLDHVCADLEGAGYAAAAADLPACSVGAPHRRQRLFWVADAERAERRPHVKRQQLPSGRVEEASRPGCFSADGSFVADAGGARIRDCRSRTDDGQARGAKEDLSERQRIWSDARHGRSCLGDADDAGREGRERPGDVELHRAAGSIRPVAQAGVLDHWASLEWLACSDGKARPVKSVVQQMVDGLPESLGRLRADQIQSIEAEIANATGQGDPGNALLDVWRSLAAETIQRPVGGLRGVQEAPLLLAFLRQLSDQGWAFAQSLPRPSEETTEGGLRVLWWQVPLAGSPHQRGLEGQQPSKPSDVVRVLSSVLARHAQAAWGEAFDANARDAFPLAHGVPGRVGRLRAYGNAIVPQVAAEFVAAVMECRP